MIQREKERERRVGRGGTTAMTSPNHHPATPPIPEPAPRQRQPSSSSKTSNASQERRRRPTSEQRQQRPSSYASNTTRRRPTSYATTAPGLDFVHHEMQQQHQQHQQRGGDGHGGYNKTPRRRSTVQSLDRSEEDGDERRGHLRVGLGGGRGAVAGVPPSVNVDHDDEEGGGEVRRLQQQRRNHARQPRQDEEMRRHRHHQHQQQQQQSMRHSSTHERQQQRHQQRRRQSWELSNSLGGGERQPMMTSKRNNTPRGGEGKVRRKKTSSHGGGDSSSYSSSTSSSSSTSHTAAITDGDGRRCLVPHPASPGDFQGGQEDDGETTTLSSSMASNKSSASQERRRLEVYVGRRAMERVERELDNHLEEGISGCLPTGAGTSPSSRSSPPSGGGGGGGGTSHHLRPQIKSVMDRRKLARVPQVNKADLIIGEYLGRGNFCDVFEVTWVPPAAERNNNGRGWTSSRGGMRGRHPRLSGEDDSKTLDIDNDLKSRGDSALSCSNDLSLLIIGGKGGRTSSSSKRSANRSSFSQVWVEGRGRLGSSSPSLLAGVVTVRGSSSSSRNPNVLALKCLRPSVRAQTRKFIIGAEDLAHETAILACLDHPNIIQLHGRAEGCFSTAFQIGSSGRGDHGEEEEGGKRKKHISIEGYFIILDRLVDTLTDRIVEWRDECRAIAFATIPHPPSPPPQAVSINGSVPPARAAVVTPDADSTLRERLCERLKVAYSIADALEYLHSHHIVFRDLKPANVGFDCNDCVKVFDFGFATSIAPLLSRPYNGYGPLTETCGTRRYMAPEVALKLGYGSEVDVYSFGMLLWEVCALEKPFESILSVDEFHDIVTLYGKRPSLHIDPLWPSSLKALMSRCWSTDPLDRPTMAEVKSRLCNVLRDVNMTGEKKGSINGVNRAAAGGDGAGGGMGSITKQLGQEQGVSFIHKWRRRISL
ncbi:hypothetical protein ACHAXA_003756 [Cyclostephanos tholiformis]|uniref:Protein kinase domain-containing protein n=1 Tax=Cyclostephanos tholiformis TaxID=382380 RepID=A0ABD3SSG2_9STRA